MNVLSKKSFETAAGVTVTATVSDCDGSACIRFDSRGGSFTNYDNKNYYPVGLTADEVAAMRALLAGDELIVEPEFNKGDLVRFTATSGHTAKLEALAVVMSPPRDSFVGRTIDVKWIDSRAQSQQNGEYLCRAFKTVSRADLTDEDYIYIGERSLAIAFLDSSE